MNTDTPTTTTEDANRLWAKLAETVIPNTGGIWMCSGWLYVPGMGRRALCGMILQSAAGGPEKEIESPEQYEDFLTKEGYINGDA